jgi:hypothetical protein
MGSRTSSSLSDLGGSKHSRKYRETKEKLMNASSRIFTGVLIDYVTAQHPMIALTYAGLQASLWAYKTYKKCERSKDPVKTLKREGEKFIIGRTKEKIAGTISTIAWNQAKRQLDAEVPKDADLLAKSAIKRTLLVAM